MRGAWEEFRRGKGSRKDVQEFEWRLEQNILSLCRDLRAHSYRHGPYSAFTICDPKQRRIHKATVRDRVLHHAVFSALNPIFEPTFIAHSFSCREGKGTHKAVSALEKWLRQVSRNYRYPCFALKCDIHQFFASSIMKSCSLS
jgi:RNA-directed DNA polymerase